jgi:hypothetical protein
LKGEKRLTRTQLTTKNLPVSAIGPVPCCFCRIHGVARWAAKIVILSEVVKRRDDAHPMASPRSPRREAD